MYLKYHNIGTQTFVLNLLDLSTTQLSFRLRKKIYKEREELMEIRKIIG